jgi:hypothetical protein
MSGRLMASRRSGTRGTSQCFNAHLHPRTSRACGPQGEHEAREVGKGYPHHASQSQRSTGTVVVGMKPIDDYQRLCCFSIGGRLHIGRRSAIAGIEAADRSVFVFRRRASSCLR